MKTIKSLVLFTSFFFSLSLSAKEYKSMEAYRVATGKTSLSKSDWLSRDRANKTFQWSTSCQYNFSYNSGYKHYQTLEEREAFLHWAAHFLNDKGHHLSYGASATEMMVILDIIKTNLSDEGINNFVKRLNEAYFLHAYETLQKLYSGAQVYKGEEAETFDKEAIAFEQTQLFQTHINRLSSKEIDKINRLLDRKGLKAKRAIDQSLVFPGNFEDLKQRIYWVENRLLPYAKTVIIIFF